MRQTDTFTCRRTWNQWKASMATRRRKNSNMSTILTNLLKQPVRDTCKWRVHNRSAKRELVRTTVCFQSTSCAGMNKVRTRTNLIIKQPVRDTDKHLRTSTHKCVTFTDLKEISYMQMMCAQQKCEAWGCQDNCVFAVYELCWYEHSAHTHISTDSGSHNLGFTA